MKKVDEPDYSRALVPKHNTLYKIIIAVLVLVIFILLLVYFGIIKPNFDLILNTSGDSSVSENVTANLEGLNFEGVTPNREIGKTLMKIDYEDNCSYTISYPQIGIEEIDDKIVTHANDLKKFFLENYKIDKNSEITFTEHIDYNSYLVDDDKMKLVFIDSIVKNDVEEISKNEYTYFFDLITGNELSADNLAITVNEGSKEFVPLYTEDIQEFDLAYSGDIVKYATTTLVVRKEKSTYAQLLGTLTPGEAIEVMAIEDDWEHVVYNGEEGYVKNGYLTRKKNLQKDVELEIVDRGIDPTKPMVAITFDDGPNPKSTPRILDTLEQYGVVATFFDLGQLVNSYPDVVQREEAIGCEVGNHSYSHKNFNVLTDEQMQEEIKNSEEAFIKVLGHKTTLFRLPYGNVNLKVKENVEYPLIKWNVDSLDWKSRDKNKILNKIRETKNYDGKIILLHSIYGTTADAVEVLVPELLNKGYQLVTVSELAYYKGNQIIKTAQEYTHF
ncbi:MAG: polysaccharide deacetylase family protein [Clostridia bacterium]|nr:polysaccharide deacetylase family protein [Clostridia bacterium]